MRFFLLFLSGFMLLTSHAQQSPPINSREILRQGNILHDSGEYTKALLLYEQIDRNDTNYVESLYERALSCESDSQYNKGIQLCKQALSLPYQRELVSKIYA